MAIDTPQKRFSIMHLAMPWRGPAVVPTGTVDAAERAAFLNYYSGIALSAPAGGGSIPHFMHHYRQMRAVA